MEKHWSLWHWEARLALSALTMLVMQGCGTFSIAPRSTPSSANYEPLPESHEIAQHKVVEPSIQVPPASSPSSERTVREEEMKEIAPPTLAPGEFLIFLESNPAGAVVVVNGIPSGRTPRKITLHGTGQGFARANISIKVRFLATNATEHSITVEELFTPLDRLPRGIMFTPDGAQRRW